MANQTPDQPKRDRFAVPPNPAPAQPRPDRFSTPSAPSSSPGSDPTVDFFGQPVNTTSGPEEQGPKRQPLKVAGQVAGRALGAAARGTGRAIGRAGRTVVRAAERKAEDWLNGPPDSPTSEETQTDQSQTSRRSRPEAAPVQAPPRRSRRDEFGGRRTTAPSSFYQGGDTVGTTNVSGSTINGEGISIGSGNVTNIQKGYNSRQYMNQGAPQAPSPVVRSRDQRRVAPPVDWGQASWPAPSPQSTTPQPSWPPPTEAPAARLTSRTQNESPDVRPSFLDQDEEQVGPPDGETSFDELTSRPVRPQPSATTSKYASESKEETKTQGAKKAVAKKAATKKKTEVVAKTKNVSAEKSTAKKAASKKSTSKKAASTKAVAPKQAAPAKEPERPSPKNVKNEEIDGVLTPVGELDGKKVRFNKKTREWIPYQE